ncbi:MAG: TraX family protein [Trueperaceae bacterium]
MTNYVPFTLPKLELTPSQQECLKWLALGLMTLDHANKMLLAFQPFLFVVGRLAFPLFVFLLAYNLEVRKIPLKKYLAPLAVTALFSQPVIVVSLEYSWTVWNIMATLLLGVTFGPVCAWLRSKNLPSFLAIPVWFVLGLFVEYGPAGVFLLPVMQWFLRCPSLISGSSLLLIGLAVNQVSVASFAPLLLVPVIYGVSKLELSLPRVRKLGYWFYPGHLLLLWGLQSFVA